MSRKKYQRQRKNILIKGGVDIKKQMLGSDVGAYFSGNFNNNHTIAVSLPVWKISFQDMKTGAVWHYQFRDRLYIGRVPIENMPVVQMVLSGDARVSKRHCMIYESQGRLCIQDLGSKNHTYVNGKRIAQASYLNSQDVLKIGNSSFKVEFDRQ